jgi:RHS repeat-associated protein
VQVNGVTDKVYYLLTDHLGSTTVSYRFDGGETRFQSYKPWGEVRQGGNSLPTDRTFTGQRWSASIGLSYYNARWYDSALGRFAQADTIIPGGVQGLDRFAAMRNNPVKYIDPSGHDVCDEDGNCYNKKGWYRSTKAPRLNTVDKLSMMIWGKFGVTMSDEGQKNWSITSLRSVYASLGKINCAVNKTLKYLIGGTSFWLQKQDSSTGQYHGETHLDGSGIDFFTIGDVALRQMNVFHEVGHLLDNIPGMKDVFTNAVKNENTPSWVSTDKQINLDALKGERILNDPNYTNPGPKARQTFSGFGESEQWADAFANYVAGNIDLSKPDGPGTAMYNFVSGALAPYIGVP